MSRKTWSSGVRMELKVSRWMRRDGRRDDSGEVTEQRVEGRFEMRPSWTMYGCTQRRRQGE